MQEVNLGGNTYKESGANPHYKSLHLASSFFPFLGEIHILTIKKDNKHEFNEANSVPNNGSSIKEMHSEINYILESIIRRNKRFGTINVTHFFHCLQ